MNMRWWNKIGLGGRTAILMIIPMMLMILALGYYVTANKISSAERNAEQRGSLLARHLSSIVELGMVARDKAVLSSYADTILKEQGVASVSMQDVEGNALVEKDIKESTNNRLEVKYFSAPVMLTEIAVGGIENDLEEGVDIDNKLIGLVRIGILTEKAGSKQERILLIGLLSTFIGVIISTLIGYKLSRLMTKPILQLNKTVSSLTTGKLTARVDEKSEGEIGALERGINNMAESLHQSQATLKNKVDDATSSLNLTVTELERKNIELEKSREQAIKLGDEKVQLLARISHELRTPLNSVIGFSRLLKKKISDHDRAEYTQTIINSATQLTSVIDDVLLFSKLEFGSLSIAQAAFSPREVCEDTIVMLSTAAQKKNIELVLLINKSVPDFMEGDEVRVKQVLTNLVTNAIKFTDAGEIIVDVSTQGVSSDSSEELLISVTDTGCGINLKKFDTLFSEFSQIDNIRTRKLDGIGLGLSISRRLARAMGGDVTVSSIEGEGSCFRFLIPLLNPILDSSLDSDSEKRDISSSSQLSGKKVLLFEPHLKSRQSLLSMFQKFDMEISVAEDKDDIIECLKFNKFDNAPDVLVLAFSAEELKSIGCGDVADKFRTLFNGPILILTGISLWELETHIPEKEQLLCLSKPLKREKLYRDLLQLLKIDVEFNDLNNEYFVGSWLTSKNILIVEDNKFNQVLLKTMLESRAAQVRIVDDGKAAIAITASEKFDVIFMDLHMPDTDGISVSRAIRKGENINSVTPIILVTADVLFDKQSLIEEQVINYVLHKPIHEEKLDQSLESCINNYVCDKSDTKGSGNNIPGHSAVSELNNELKQEILRLCGAIASSVEQRDKRAAKESIHQLLGMSGYYQLKEVTQAVSLLQTAVNNDNKVKSLSQLQKIEQLISV